MPTPSALCNEIPNLLTSGEDLCRGTTVTGIKLRKTLNTRKRNKKGFPASFRVFRVFRGCSCRLGCGFAALRSLRLTCSF